MKKTFYILLFALVINACSTTKKPIINGEIITSRPNHLKVVSENHRFDNYLFYWNDPDFLLRTLSITGIAKMVEDKTGEKAVILIELLSEQFGFIQLANFVDKDFLRDKAYQKHNRIRHPYLEKIKINTKKMDLLKFNKVYETDSYTLLLNTNGHKLPSLGKLFIDNPKKAQSILNTIPAQKPKEKVESMRYDYSNHFLIDKGKIYIWCS
ncbi:MAG: hypothetical protein N4A45_01435 [Flavobacteriales bacterium]|jgi:hypothetical protein|nr:hypothetical protein [Flavobacteriales bacterium]